MTIALYPLMTWVIVGCALVVLTVAFLLGRRSGLRRSLSAARHLTHPANLSYTAVSDSACYRHALIVNPTKTDVRRLASVAEAICRFEGWSPPLVLETTIDDCGEGAAVRALDEGVDVVIAAGGDGTIRAVASALAGASTPMG